MLIDLAVWTIVVAVMVAWARLAVWLIGRPETGKHHRGRSSDRDSRNYSGGRPRPPRAEWENLYGEALYTDQLLAYAKAMLPPPTLLVG